MAPSNACSLSTNERHDAQCQYLLWKLRPSLDLKEHFRKLAVLFLFDQDPDHEELEAEKDLVMAESQAAYKKAADRMERDEANHPL